MFGTQSKEEQYFVTYEIYKELKFQHTKFYWNTIPSICFVLSTAATAELNKSDRDSNTAYSTLQWFGILGCNQYGTENIRKIIACTDFSYHYSFNNIV
jgi:hypothetical protein